MIWIIVILPARHIAIGIIYFTNPYRSMSEKYGFVIPIAHYLHENYPDSVHQNPNKGIDLELKQMAQKYFEEHYGTREEFRKIFGKSRL